MDKQNRDNAADADRDGPRRFGPGELLLWFEQLDSAGGGPFMPDGRNQSISPRPGERDD